MVTALLFGSMIVFLAIGVPISLPWELLLWLLFS